MHFACLWCEEREHDLLFLEGGESVANRLNWELWIRRHLSAVRRLFGFRWGLDNFKACWSKTCREHPVFVFEIEG